MLNQVSKDQQFLIVKGSCSSKNNIVLLVSSSLSIKQWDKWYDMQFHPRMAQNAVDGMQSWRAAMLQSHTPAAPDLTLSTALHCGHVMVSESEESLHWSCCSESGIDIELD